MSNLATMQGHEPDDSLDAFIREMLVHKIARFEVRQITAGGGSDRVGDVRPLSPDESAEAISDKLTRMIARDAHALRGMCSYAVLAFVEGEPQSMARYPVRVDGRVRGDDALQPTESPDREGITTMLMRHTEAATRMSTLAAGDHIRMLQTENKSLREHVRKLEGRTIQIFDLLEEVTSQRAARELAQRREDRADVRSAAVVGQLVKYVPDLIDRLMSGAGLGSKGGGTLHAAAKLGGILRGLEETQLTQILHIVGPDKAAELLPIVGAIVEAEELADPIPGKPGGPIANGAPQPRARGGPHAVT